ncbi:glycosyl hydrolase 108 family protein [Mucilaginibacter ximonensis]|uniref:Glycosyl hydrolase 108 family protein n=1 Tax=Mucilaginibacter ximonensis TaxID=538021 RepID=A0ABW5YFG6_9SPHI
MANFNIAYQRTIIKIEGEYNPGNGEAETYRGIDRGANPKWPGWAIIDAIKKESPGISVARMNAALAANTQLQADIQSFYKANYWDVLSLDAVSSQIKANALFDCSVNPCIIGVVKAAQIACNAIKQKSVSVDGDFGALTLACINALDEKLFDLAFCAVRQANYYERTRLTPSASQWLSSWLFRSARQLS